MALLDTIQQAQKIGASSNDILGQITKQNQGSNIANSINQAMASGANSDAVLQEIIKQNSAPKTLQDNINAGDTGYFSGLASRVASEQVAGAKTAAGSIQEGANLMQQGQNKIDKSKSSTFVNPLQPNSSTPDQKSKMLQGLVGAGKIAEGTALSATGGIAGVVQSVLAPVTAVVSPVIKAEIPTILSTLKYLHPELAQIVSNLAPKVQEKVIPEIQNIIKQHPDIAAIAGNTINDALLAVGGGEVKAPLEKAIADTSITDLKNSLTGLPGDISGAVSKASSDLKTGLSSSYKNSEISGFAKPTSVPKAAYNRATTIFNNAGSQGINIPEVLFNNGIKNSDIVTNGVYDTKDVVSVIKNDAASLSRDLLRPSLEAANDTVAKVPVNDIQQTALDLASSNKTADKADIIATIKNIFSDKRAGSLASDYKNGFSLTDLHDNKIKYSSGVYDVTKPAKNVAEKYIADSFRTTLENTAPKDIPVKEFNAELTKQYKSADYLNALHGKTAPVSIASKIAKGVAKVVGAGVGEGLTGGLLGGVAGYHLGGLLESAVEGMPNPLRNYFLDNLAKTNPEAFTKVQDYLKNLETNGSVAQPINNISSSIAKNPISKVSNNAVTKSSSLSTLETEAKKYKSPEDFVAKIRGSATQYGDYTPQLRHYGMEDYKNISELGVKPDEMVTIYRGIDKTTGKIKKTINDGDFVTTDHESALSYTGDAKDVVSMKVPAKTLYTDAVKDFKDEPFYTGSEYVYTKQKVTPMNKSQLTKIWEDANK